MGLGGISRVHTDTKIFSTHTCQHDNNRGKWFQHLYKTHIQVQVYSISKGKCGCMSKTHWQDSLIPQQPYQYTYKSTFKIWINEYTSLFFLKKWRSTDVKHINVHTLYTLLSFKFHKSQFYYNLCKNPRSQDSQPRQEHWEREIECFQDMLIEENQTRTDT